MISDRFDDHPPLQPLHALQYTSIVRDALQEDLGRAGDLTTDAIVSDAVRARAHIVARAPGRVAGLPVALRAFVELDPDAACTLVESDGHDVKAGGILAVVTGSARALLTAERTALNLLGHLCGVATATRDLVAATHGHRARVVCTRKTTPGLRTLEKHAVRAGGGFNHRFGLDDAVLIKDNHLIVAGGIRAAVERVRARLGHMVKIEVEVDTLEQLEVLLDLRVDAVLLDNMDAATLGRAVARVDRRLITEASGGVSAQTIRDIAAAGVDLISVGRITHSAPALDIGLDFDASPPSR